MLPLLAPWHMGIEVGHFSMQLPGHFQMQISP